MNLFSALLMSALLAVCALGVGPARASDAAYALNSDCLIESLNADYSLGDDSSLAVVETIRVNCYDLAGKHGIFRILPTVLPASLRPEGSYLGTPVHINSITDEAGRPQTFATQHDNWNTLTWKIGDPNTFITGIHTYKIAYSVANAAGPARQGGDAFVWNVQGQFWQLPTDHFTATVHLPPALSQAKATVGLASGPEGEAGNSLGATYAWLDSNTLTVDSSNPLPLNNGITLSVLYPSGLLRPYRPSWVQAHPADLAALLFALLSAGYYLLWRSYGSDAPSKGVFAPEFAAPEGLRPAELKAIDLQGGYSTLIFTATVIDLAVRGYLRIEKMPARGLFHSESITFVLVNDDLSRLAPFEKQVVAILYGTPAPDRDSAIDLATVKGRLSKSGGAALLGQVGRAVISGLEPRRLFDRSSRPAQFGMVLGSAAAAVLGGALVGQILPLPPELGVGLLAALPVIVLFTALMPRYTSEGAVLAKRIKGFKLYLGKAERFRQQFNEKENIFDRFLSYAVVFGLTKQWIRAMQQLYGPDYAYAPAWYVGALGDGGLGLDQLTADISSISGAISNSAASGYSAGSSGGGGGGGGGGSW